MLGTGDPEVGGPLFFRSENLLFRQAEPPLNNRRSGRRPRRNPASGSVKGDFERLRLFSMRSGQQSSAVTDGSGARLPCQEQWGIKAPSQWLPSKIFLFIMNYFQHKHKWKE